MMKSVRAFALAACAGSVAAAYAAQPGSWGPGRPLAASPAAVSDPAPAPTPDPPAVQTRQQKLDELFSRLAAATDPAELEGLVVAIDRLMLELGSSTGDLLMARAIAAMGSHNLEVSRALLDKIVVLRPDWAEAWNKRATVRFLMDDEKGSMADIARVLALEPRHVGALSGMGMILERSGFRDAALRAYGRALEIAPHLESVRNAVDRLTAAAKGQSL